MRKLWRFLLVLVFLAALEQSVLARTPYNEDYMIRHEQELNQERFTLPVKKVLNSVPRTSREAELQGELQTMLQQQSSYTEQVIAMRKQETALMQGINALGRQRRNNNNRLKELQIKLELLTPLE